MGERGQCGEERERERDRESVAKHEREIRGERCKARERERVGEIVACSKAYFTNGTQ